MVKSDGVLIVSWDFANNGDDHVLIVGEQIKAGNVEVINAFRGDEAHDIYDKLTTVKKGD